MRAERLEKQMNATVPLAVWWDKESAEARANIYRRKPVNHLLNKYKTILTLWVLWAHIGVWRKLSVWTKDIYMRVL